LLGYGFAETVDWWAGPRSQRPKDFMVDLPDGRRVPVIDVPLAQPGLADDAGDEEMTDYAVRVEWIKTLARGQAIREKGMFANQNTVVRLRDPFTLERLTRLFSLDEPEADGTLPSGG